MLSFISEKVELTEVPPILTREPIDLGYCRARLGDQDNLIILHYHKNAELELMHIKELVAIGEQIYESTGRSTLICNIIEPGFVITREAREYSITPEATRCGCASATVLHSLAQRIIGNFFRRALNPHLPFKLFQNEEKAMVWLKEMEQKRMLEGVLG